jgi:hypothetical protein
MDMDMSVITKLDSDRYDDPTKVMVLFLDPLISEESNLGCIICSRRLTNECINRQSVDAKDLFCICPGKIIVCFTHFKHCKKYMRLKYKFKLMKKTSTDKIRLLEFLIMHHFLERLKPLDLVKI